MPTHHPTQAHPLKLVRVKMGPCVNANGLKLLDQLRELRVVLAPQVLRVQVGSQMEEALQILAVVLKGGQHLLRQHRIAQVLHPVPAIQPVDLVHSLQDAVREETGTELHQNLVQHETTSRKPHQDDGKAVVVVAEIVVDEDGKRVQRLPRGVVYA